jgi:nicotinate-nucleotide--dimethylbenzimidazole phosphoribosyltransferase
VDVALESVPPEVEVTAAVEVASVEIASVEVAASLEPAIEAEAEAEPVPLAADTPHYEPAPPPADDFSLESEVSEVRMANLTREPGPEVTVAAIEAEAEPIPDEELSEDDLVEVSEATPGGSTDVDIDFEDEPEEQAPASSQRSRVASNLDEALAAAAAQLESDPEPPLKTPPPESGPQEAPLPPPITSPAAPDVDALLGSEVDISSGSVAAISEGPTAEQLGQTIDLEDARGPSLELAEPRVDDAALAAVSAAVPMEELEVALPGPTVAGGYDANLQPPPEAQQELEDHLRRQVDDIPPPPESLAQYPSVQPPAPEIVAAPAVGLAPELVARPLPTGSPEAFVSVRETFRPRSFAELLDASLGLSAD